MTFGYIAGRHAAGLAEYDGKESASAGDKGRQGKTSIGLGEVKDTPVGPVPFHLHSVSPRSAAVFTLGFFPSC
jgi:hypothetical protein